MAAKIKTLIVDDEPLARRNLRVLLERDPQIEILDECRNGREAVKAINTLSPDLIFLDIQMPEIDGFEVIRRRTSARMPAVVFLTAYDQFAIRAFEADAHDYLVKPVSEARFAATIKRLARRLGAGEGAAAREQVIVASTARGATVLRLREIDWIEAADNYARIRTGNRGYLLRESLGTLEDRIGSSGFVRAHRRALVRVDAVQRLTTNDNGLCVAILSSGTRIPVSRRRRANFLRALRAARA